MEAAVRALVERFWKDVSALPWQDPGWVKNEAIKEQTRKHFVNATTEDLMLAFNQQELIKEDDDATTASND